MRRVPKLERTVFEVLAPDLEREAAETRSGLECCLIGQVVADHDRPAALEARKLHKPRQSRSLCRACRRELKHAAPVGQNEMIGMSVQQTLQLLLKDRLHRRDSAIVQRDSDPLVLHLHTRY